MTSLVLAVLSTSIAFGGSVEVFKRTQAVLNHYNVSAEPQPQVQNLALKQSLNGVKQLLPYLDPKDAFQRFSTIEPTTQYPYVLKVFQDYDSKTIEDFQIPLNSGDEPAEHPYRSHLLTAKQHAGQAPLYGLRIAIDPGHMGSPAWDKITGKWVHDKQGNILSEGILTLQTALLLEDAFKKMGAEVLVTRHALVPVSPMPVSSVDVKYWGAWKLAESSLDPWFQKLLLAGQAGPNLFRAFETSSDVKKLFESYMRDEYFVSPIDLDARVDLINAFRPDITLVIHYDTSDPAGDPNGINPLPFDKTKTYVAGGFEPAEFATRSDRAEFVRLLADSETWLTSVYLSRQVVHAMEKRLGIGPDENLAGNAKLVEPGILARNLALTRGVTDSVLTYVECLYYNDQSEFDRFRKPDHFMNIAGMNYPYSDRLLQVTDALSEAVVSFVANYQ